MRNIRARFADGNSLVTGINGTDSEIREYYLGKFFNLGVESDRMVECVAVEFLDVRRVDVRFDNGASKVFEVNGSDDEINRYFLGHEFMLTTCPVSTATAVSLEILAASVPVSC